MPSLKDLRNRIASVKATQKITKAMQMVAAAKLRRAQEAAEAARPYSQRMGAVLANIAQAVGGGGEAPALMTGTGKERRASAGRLHGRARAVRRLQLADRAPRPRPRPPPARRRQDGQDHLRRQEGLRHPAPRLRPADHRPRRSARGQDSSASSMPTRSPARSSRCSTRAQFDVCTLFYSEFKSVITPGSDGAADHPGGRAGRSGGAGRRPATPSMNTSRSRATSSPISSRATSPCRSSGRCSRTRRARWAPR